MTTVTFQDNMVLFEELWPRFRMEPSLRSIIVEKWGSLHQDKLRECIRQHRLERDTKPDLAAIHKAYCRVTGIDSGSDVAQREIARTRRQAEEAQGPSEAETQAWDAWADAVLATSSDRERAAVTERFGMLPTNRRYLATMIHYARKHPESQPVKR